MDQNKDEAISQKEETKKNEPESVSISSHRAWTEEVQCYLLKLAQENQILLETMKGDDIDWQAIADELNSHCHSDRTSKQCKER